jgi:hypothetical protein
MSNIQDLVNEVKRPRTWIPYVQDGNGRQTDEPDPAMPNPLAGHHTRLDTAKLHDGREIPIAVIETEDGGLFGVWLWPENANGKLPVQSSAWLEKKVPVGAMVAVISDPLKKGENGFYHPIRVAWRPEETDPPAIDTSDAIPF